jgi:hypothetical protein
MPLELERVIIVASPADPPDFPASDSSGHLEAGHPLVVFFAAFPTVLNVAFLLDIFVTSSTLWRVAVVVCHLNSRTTTTSSSIHLFPSPFGGLFPVLSSSSILR